MSNFAATPTAPHSAEWLNHKYDVLKRHCEILGRSYAEIEKSTIVVSPLTTNGSGNSEQPSRLLERLGELAAVGVDQVMLSVPTILEPGTIELIGREVIPAAADIQVAGR